MQDSKLTQFFRSLPAQELRWLRDFVASPYFNRHDDPVLLCDYYIQLARRDFPAAGLERQRMYEKVFGTATCDERHLAYVASDLLKLGERFVAQREYESEALRPMLDTLRVCAKRGPDKSYTSTQRRVDRLLANVAAPTARHYLWQYERAVVTEQYLSRRNLRDASQDHLAQSSRALDLYYLLRRLHLTCVELDQAKLGTLPYQVSDTAPLKALASQLADESTPALNVYLQLLALLEDGAYQPARFDAFYADFIRHAAHFSATDQWALCYLSLNYQLRPTNAGDRAAAARMLSVYEEGLQHGFLLDTEGHISPWDFKNVTKLGLALRRFEWVLRFSETYAPQLPAEQRQDAYHFNLADLSYHQQDYDTALYHLNQVEFSDIHYNLGAKAMLLKIYYETDAEEAFLSLIASFRVFVKRQRTLTPYFKAAYLNFIELLHLIYKNGDRNSTALRRRIADAAPLNARSWLLGLVGGV